MRSWTANGDSRRLLWRYVREFAVPQSMIESATARRQAGDWAGACAAARVDADVHPRSIARSYGKELAAQVRTDLRQLAPDLLRWHLPRIAPDGLLRPGLTISLTRYQTAGNAGDAMVHLVARTPPAWADAGQRISLALWDDSRAGPGTCPHPHPRPNQRFRLDLHRHLWDARRTSELRVRSGAGRLVTGDRPPVSRGPRETVLRGRGCAVDRWTAEAAIALWAEGQTEGAVTVRLGSRHRLVLHLAADGDDRLRIADAATRGDDLALPVLPDAATWALPDLELLQAGLINADRLHPLVAAALVPGHQPAAAAQIPGSGGVPRLVECRGAQHRIGLVDGVLVPLDHDPAEIRHEELLAALTGTPLPCLRAIDEIHRHPENLADIRARLDHGDADGALAAVEDLLGPDVLLRSGALRDELETAALRRVEHGLYRAGLAGLGGPGPTTRTGPRSRDRRAHPRFASAR